MISRLSPGTTGHIQPKRVVLDATFPLKANSMHKKTKKSIILSRETDNQRILQSVWTRRKPSHTQPRLVVSDANFH